MGGRKLSAHEALDRRLLTAVFGPTTMSDESTLAFQAEATARAHVLAALPPKSLRASKTLYRAPELKMLHAVNMHEAEILKERWTSDDCMEAVSKFMMEQMVKQKSKKSATGKLAPKL
jgi:enoyl-CoA hydratase/carnithine racemase